MDLIHAKMLMNRGAWHYLVIHSWNYLSAREYYIISMLLKPADDACSTCAIVKAIYLLNIIREISF